MSSRQTFQPKTKAVGNSDSIKSDILVPENIPDEIPTEKIVVLDVQDNKWLFSFVVDFDKDDKNKKMFLCVSHLVGRSFLW